MFGQVFRQEYEFSFWNGLPRIHTASIERIDRQCAVYLDGFVIVAIEHQPAAEAAHSPLARLPQDGEAPHVCHSYGGLGLILLPRPLEVFLKIQRCAARERQQSQPQADPPRRTAAKLVIHARDVC